MALQSINPEELRYYQKRIMDKAQDLESITKELNYLLDELLLVDSEDIVKNINSIKAECIKQNLYSLLLKEYSRVLSDIADRYEDTKMKVNIIISQ